MRMRRHIYIKHQTECLCHAERVASRVHDRTYMYRDLSNSTTFLEKILQPIFVIKYNWTGPCWKTRLHVHDNKKAYAFEASRKMVISKHPFPNFDGE
jgi:hypothetical protein